MMCPGVSMLPNVGRIGNPGLTFHFFPQHPSRPGDLLSRLSKGYVKLFSQYKANGACSWPLTFN